MNLQKDISIGKSKYPSKTTMNMAMREDKGMSTPKLILWIVVIVIIVFLAAKFGAIDQLNRLSTAESNYNAKVQENDALLAQIADYDDVLKEYRLYSTDWMSEYGTEATISRQDVLDMLETYIFPKGNVISVTITGNTVKVNMSGMTLDKISKMFNQVETSPIVASVSLDTASAEIQNDVNSEFSITINLQNPDADETATEEVAS